MIIKLGGITITITEITEIAGIAEITINSAEEVPAAMDLVHALIANGISAAKIIRPRTALSSKCSEGPPPDPA